MDQIIDIREWGHVEKVRRDAAKLASQHGFSEQAIGEISIAVSELAENLMSHRAIQGKIVLSVLELDERKGIQIVSEDRGPGIANIDRAIQDGYSQKSSLGIGLGAVRRLMDEFDISSKTERSRTADYEGDKDGIGTVVMARKWMLPEQHPAKAKHRELRFGIMSRPKNGESVNGDAYFLKHVDGRVLVAVIDGLGHGVEAEDAARQASLTLHDHHRDPLDVILSWMHERLRKTRGAAVSLALIDEKRGTLDYAAVGNVIARVYRSPQPVRPVNVNGIVGVNVRKVKVSTFPWSDRNIIVLTSDGISTKYDPDRYPDVLNKHPMVIAAIIMRDYGRATDDATVVVGGPA